MMHNPSNIDRLQQFSSSVVTYAGFPTGNTSTNDVARRINETAVGISNFIDPFGTVTGTINGPSSITSAGYYSYSSDISCGNTPYTYQWATSSDGYNYYNASTSSSNSVGVYPGSSYATSGNLYLRLTVHSADAQTQNIFKYVGVSNVHNIKIDNSSLGGSKLSGEVFLSEASPNPANNNTTFEFFIPSKQNVKLELFNHVGQNIRLLESGDYEQGIYQYRLNIESLTAGIYLYRLTAGEFSSVKKLIVTK